MTPYCDNCGTILQREDKFCAECGSRLDDLKEQETVTEEEIRKILITLNNLLSNLPDELIEEFIRSEEFPIYEKIMRIYRIE